MRFARLQLGGRLDRYVGGLFVGAYATSLLLIVGLVVILDVASNLQFFEPWPDGSSASTLLIARYYALNTPFLFLQVAPFITVSAAMFTVAKLARHNEIVAGLNAGVSAQRMFAPLLFGALVAALAMFVLREKATVALGERRDALQDALQHHRDQRVVDELWFRDVAGNIVRFEEFRPAQAGVPQAVGDGLEVAVQGGATLRIATAERAVWEGEHWRLEQGSLREETGSTSRTSAIDTLDGLITFTPRDLMLALKGFQRPMELSFSEVGELMGRDPDNREYQTLLQYHLTFPLANVVLLLIVLPFLVGRERGRKLEGLVLGSLMCVVYFAVDFVARTLGMEGALSPMVSSWLPVLLFGSLGAVLFDGLAT